MEKIDTFNHVTDFGAVIPVTRRMTTDGDKTTFEFSIDFGFVVPIPRYMRRRAKHNHRRKKHSKP